MTRVPEVLVPRLQGESAQQGGVGYSSDGWRGWTGGLPGNHGLLDFLPATLDRYSTARIVNDRLAQQPRDIVPAFTVAMMWGHGGSGYGPYRTACVLTGERSPAGRPASSGVLAGLNESIDVARSGGPVAGYRFLNNGPHRGRRLVPGLGPAFFTKWLYFITARGDATSPSAAPILDALVIRWLGEYANVSLRAGYTDDYSRYVDTLTSWGGPYDLAPAAVEERIFCLIRTPAV